MRAPTHRQAGLTLVELTVTMAVSSVLLLAVGAVFMGSLSSARGVSSRSEATAAARFATDTLQRRLRVAIQPTMGAPMFLSTGPDQVSFYASLAPAAASSATPPTKVDYLVDTSARCLRESLTPGVGTGPYTFPAAGLTSRCLVFATFNAGGAPVFTYYASAAATSPLATGTDPVVLASIRSIGLSVAVHDLSTSPVAATEVGTRVTLLNPFLDVNGGVVP